MPKVKSNYCNGCPDCHHCNLKYDVNEYYCDNCDKLLAEQGYKVDQEVMCRECAWEYITTNKEDDILSEYRYTVEDLLDD